MSGSRQAKDMRHRHMTSALAEVQKASNALAEARDWLFDLDHVSGVRERVAAAKTAVAAAQRELSQLVDREFFPE